MRAVRAINYRKRLLDSQNNPILCHSLAFWGTSFLSALCSLYHLSLLRQANFRCFTTPQGSLHTSGDGPVCGGHWYQKRKNEIAWDKGNTGKHIYFTSIVKNTKDFGAYITDWAPSKEICFHIAVDFLIVSVLTHHLFFFFFKQIQSNSAPRSFLLADNHDIYHILPQASMASQIVPKHQMNHNSNQVMAKHIPESF